MAEEENKHAGGRPPIFADPEALKAKVDDYFVWVQGEKEIIINQKGEPEEKWKRFPKHVTITGLALHLGFESRQSIYDYEEKGEFSYIIKNARLRVEENYEQNLHGNNCTGSIFALKNMGWKDKTETALTDPDGNALPPPIINVFTNPATPKIETKSGE